MLIVDHRINSIEDLARVPRDRGIEVDLRDYDGEIRMTHDPFVRGPKFEELLRCYDHAQLILNVKCDGLEDQLREMLSKYGIENYFFLDCANPTLVRLVRIGEQRIAVRFSEFEPIENCLAFAGKVDWVWVDCFTRLPLDRDSWKQLSDDFRICLVSPELQKHSTEQIANFREQLHDMPIDAVCTDFPELWQAEVPA